MAENTNKSRANRRKNILFWIREVAGWTLVVFALYLLRAGLIFVMDLESPRIVEAAVVTLAGLGVLRAGVMLIRLSTAARVYRLDLG